MITMNLDLIAQMSCNPAIGGIAKGHLVREMDALGGVMGEVPMRRHPVSPAEYQPRARQCGRRARSATRSSIASRMREVLEREPNLRILQAEVAEIATRTVLPPRRVTGVLLRDGRAITADAVVVTTGTFLNGLAHVGEMKYSCGRNGEAPSNLLGDQLRTLGLGLDEAEDRHAAAPRRPDHRMGPLRSAAWGCAPTPFSFLTSKIEREQIKCYIAYTSERNAADSAGQHRALATVQWPDRRYRAALLPFDRGQGGQVPGQDAGIRSSWSPRAWTRTRCT